MSGHSKWANIKNKKGRQDSLRGKIFTKIGKEIAVAVKENGVNPESNTRLRDAIAKAKASNMPSDNVNRAIKKAAGEVGSVNYEEIVYEGYGPSGIAVIVNALTDNRNRTASEVRHAFDKFSGNLGTTGCVSFMFEKKGLIVVENTDEIDEDELMMNSLDAGAEDFSPEGDVFEIITAPEEFSNVREKLESTGINFISAEISMIPSTTTKIEGDDVVKFLKMLDKFDNDEDVQNYWHNAEFDEE
ncbi:MAG: YebC/PmpR family DNA-binding transcriptional regulator [Clostridium sp.]